VVVETQSGAGGAIGAEAVARAAPTATPSCSLGERSGDEPVLSKSARLDPLKDFTPITKAFETVALVVDQPRASGRVGGRLIEYAKRHPGKLSFGTSGIGTTHHLSGESIRLLTGIDWVHVPYKGGPPVITDLIAGEIQVGFSILATAHRSSLPGRIRILAVNGAKRYHVSERADPDRAAARLPSRPRPGRDTSAGRMPRAIVVRLRDEIVRILQLAGKCRRKPRHRLPGGEEHARRAPRDHPARYEYTRRSSRRSGSGRHSHAGKLKLSI